MICAPCKAAGALLPPEMSAPLFTVVRDLHADCKGGTWCDCQHKTDQSYITQQVKRGQNVN